MTIAVLRDTTNNKPSGDLDARIADAFREDAKSEAVADLITETETAAFAASEAAEQARARALDPLSSANEVAEARRQMADILFKRDRLEAAVIRLRERLEELKDQEEDHRRSVAYEEAKVQRDALA